MASRLDAFKGTDSPERTALKAAVKSAQTNASNRPMGMVSAAPVKARTTGMVSPKTILGAGLAAGAADAITNYKAEQKKAIDDIGM